MHLPCLQCVLQIASWHISDLLCPRSVFRCSLFELSPSVFPRFTGCELYGSCSYVQFAQLTVPISAVLGFQYAPLVISFPMFGFPVLPLTMSTSAFRFFTFPTLRCWFVWFVFFPFLRLFVSFLLLLPSFSCLSPFSSSP